MLTKTNKDALGYRSNNLAKLVGKTPADFKVQPTSAVWTKGGIEYTEVSNTGYYKDYDEPTVYIRSVDLTVTNGGGSGGGSGNGAYVILHEKDGSTRRFNEVV